MELDNRNQSIVHHFKVEYSTDSGSTWTTLKSDEEVPLNTSETYSGPELTNGDSICLPSGFVFTI